MKCSLENCDEQSAGYLTCVMHGVSGKRYTNDYAYCADDIVEQSERYIEYGYDSVTIHYYGDE